VTAVTHAAPSTQAAHEATGLKSRSPRGLRRGRGRSPRGRGRGRGRARAVAVIALDAKPDSSQRAPTRPRARTSVDLPRLACAGRLGVRQACSVGCKLCAFNAPGLARRFTQALGEHARSLRGKQARVRHRSGRLRVVPSGRPAADAETLAFTQERKRAQRERDSTRRRSGAAPSRSVPARRCRCRWRRDPGVQAAGRVESQCVYLISSSRSEPPETSIARTAWPLPLA
jgi:hypothetical protein